jgi:hypothetical protein
MDVRNLKFFLENFILKDHQILSKKNLVQAVVSKSAPTVHAHAAKVVAPVVHAAPIVHKPIIAAPAPIVYQQAPRKLFSIFCKCHRIFHFIKKHKLSDFNGNFVRKLKKKKKSFKFFVGLKKSLDLSLSS